MLKGKKVCGILSEASISCEEKTLNNIIIGIGLNVDNNINSEIKNIATNLSSEIQKPINKSILLAEIIKNMQNLTKDIHEKKYFSEYKKRLFILGKKITINNEEGIALKLNKDCSLLVDIGGVKKKFYVGDVSIKI